ncbi:hypothetical protein FB45DRAFT_876967 [Roridomyces roridus]|uniref:Uncharacterized protein n=1 Tax=Roridomyces roridus TaxID=1738132 RepID=A0AAD7B3B1_9AGAR|nr:hypothetical protein FB45DRAFT_876967 [Roridomyces roridus]
MSTSVVHHDFPYAEPAPPPPPKIVLLAHTDLHGGGPCGCLLLHGDLGDKPMPPKKKVSFLPETNTMVHTYPPAPQPTPTPSSAVVPKIPPPCSVSRNPLDDKVYSASLSWSTDKISEFKAYVQQLADENLDTNQSLTSQSADRVTKVITMTLLRYPELDNFKEHWPLRCVLIYHLKNRSRAAKQSIDRKITNLVRGEGSYFYSNSNGRRKIMAPVAALARVHFRFRNKTDVILLDHLLFIHLLDVSPRQTLFVPSTSVQALFSTTAKGSSNTPQTRSRRRSHDDEEDRANNPVQRQPVTLPKVRLVVVPDPTSPLELAQEKNYALRSELSAAQESAKHQAAQLEALRAQLFQQQATIDNMTQHEGEMEPQFFGDQEKIDKMTKDVSALYPQLLASQKQLMECNKEIDRLQRLHEERTSEALQLRHQAQASKSPLQAPRRGKRTNLTPVHNISRRPIEIPLDPAPIPGSSGRAEAATTAPPPPSTDPEVEQIAQRVAALLKDSFVTINGKSPKSKPSKKKTIECDYPKEVVTYVNNKLRQITLARFDVQQAGDFAFHVPASARLAKACGDGLNNDPPAGLFQWDFSDGYGKSRWNDLMMQKIVNLFLRDDGANGVLTEHGVHRDFLEQKLGEQLGRYRTSWKAYQPRFLEAQGRMETQAEAHARALGANDQHLLSSRSTTMKTAKFTKRKDTVDKTIEIKKLDGTAQDIATWERLLEMLILLGEQGMSSEDEDELEVDGIKIPVFIVKICIWREPRIVDYLRLVDAQTAQFKGVQRPRGPKPATRVRKPGNGNGVAKAPVGLPHSLYNEQWLAAASPSYLKELKVSKEAFELFVAATGRMGS